MSSPLNAFRNSLYFRASSWTKPDVLGLFRAWRADWSLDVCGQSASTLSPAGHADSKAGSRPALPNSVQETYTYNNRLQPARIQLGSNVSGHSADDSCLVYNNYTVATNATTCAVPAYPPPAGASNNGNVMGHYYQDGKYPTWGHTLAYTYDSLNRLSSALAKDLSSATLWNPAFTYDRWGNMSCSGSGLCTSVGYSTANNNRLASVAAQTATYDAAGDLTGDGTQTYQWDGEGHLTQVYNSVTGTTSTFTYNALGQRVGKARTNPVGNFEYVFDPAGQEAGEFNSY